MYNRNFPLNDSKDPRNAIPILIIPPSEYPKDVAVYRNEIKGSLRAWHQRVAVEGSVASWLVVHASALGAKGKPALFKETVIDRLRADFGGRAPDEYVAWISIII